MVIGITEIIISLITSGTTLLGLYLAKKWEKKNEPDLSDPDFEDKIKDLLDLIRDEVGACRVSYWEGSNGTNTLSGYHMKKLSMMGESNKEGFEEIKDEMQMLPVSTFKRTMDLLRESEDGTVFSIEHMINDDLANLNKGYGINSMYVLKVKTIFNKWTGILVIGFEEPFKTLTEEELAWLKTQASRIGVMIRSNGKNKK